MRARIVIPLCRSFVIQSPRVAALPFGLILACLHLAQAEARGDIIAPPQIRTIAPTDTNWATDTTPAARYTPFDRFSSRSPGDELTGVILNISYVVESPYSVTFKTAADYLLHTYVAFSAYLPDGTPLADQATLFNEFVSFSGTSGQTISDPGRGVRGSLAPIVLSAPTALGLFQGPGSIYIPMVAGAYVGTVETSGNVGRMVRTRVGVTLSLQYLSVAGPTSSSVPEPASQALMVMGGVGLLAGKGLRRRARRCGLASR